VPEAATEKLNRFLLHTEEMKLLVMYKDSLPAPMVWEATGSDMKNLSVSVFGRSERSGGDKRYTPIA
jgi:hypothetical protein